MIASLSGLVVSRDFNEVVIEAGGVGYGINMSIRDVSLVESESTVKVYISEVIREQAFDLYGFLNIEDKKLFDQVLKVNGVGPRIALALLGLGNRDSFARAVSNDDSSYLARAPGVGRKLAERLCVELRDKITSFGMETQESNTRGDLDVREALAALGFKNADIDKMMKNVDASDSVEDQIKNALRDR